MSIIICLEDWNNYNKPWTKKYSDPFAVLNWSCLLYSFVKYEFYVWPILFYRSLDKQTIHLMSIIPIIGFFYKKYFSSKEKVDDLNNWILKIDKQKKKMRLSISISHNKIKF